MDFIVGILILYILASAVVCIKFFFDGLESFGNKTERRAAFRIAAIALTMTLIVGTILMCVYNSDAYNLVENKQIVASKYFNTIEDGKSKYTVAFKLDDSEYAFNIKDNRITQSDSNESYLEIYPNRDRVSKIYLNKEDYARYLKESTNLGFD